MSPVRETIAAGLKPFGLVLRSGFTALPSDDLPPLADGRPPRAVLMIGNVGESGGDPMWRAFASARANFPGDHPMNDWTRAAIDPLA